MTAADRNPQVEGTLMDTPRTRIWTIARIVALGLIGLTIAGLGYLRAVEHHPLM